MIRVEILLLPEVVKKCLNQTVLGQVFQYRIPAKIRNRISLHRRELEKSRMDLCRESWVLLA